MTSQYQKFVTLELKNVTSQGCVFGQSIHGNASDFINQPLPKDSVSAHGASHHARSPGLPPSKSSIANTITSVAVINASTVVCFFKGMQLFNVTLHQNSKLDPLRFGLTFQIANLLSCRRVWKVDSWHIYIIKISQDLCSIGTINKHIIKDQKSYCCFGKIFIFGNGPLNTVLY